MIKYFFIIFILINILLAHSLEKRFLKKELKTKCHLKELEDCFKKLEKYSNDENASLLLTNERGIDIICTNTLDTIDCIKTFLNKCATALQRELYSFISSHFIYYIDAFCKPGEKRSKFLNHSVCIHDKVLQQKQYKKNCLAGFINTVDIVKDYDLMDDRLNAICCSHNRWQNCLNSMVNKKCNKDAEDSMINFLDGSFGNLINMLCPKDEFVPDSKECMPLYAKNSTMVNASLSQNPITKYTALYFGFLFKYE